MVQPRTHILAGALALISLLFLINSPSASAGAACFPACVIACCECAGGPAAFAGPLGIVVGVTGCTGICMVACATLVWLPPACFANDTRLMVVASNGTLLQTPISHVHVDDRVLTLLSGQPGFTRVVRNVQSNGSFDFFEFELRSPQRAASTLKVTAQHGMLVLDAMDELRFALPADVNVGDRMRTSDGTAWEVSRIDHAVGHEKFTLETTDGSVLASGVLVSTVCNEEVSTGAKMDDVMAGWKRRHPYTLPSSVQA